MEGRHLSIEVNFKCTWADYHTAVVAKLKATPAMMKRPFSLHAAALVSTTFARVTKLRGLASYVFDDVGVRRSANGIEKAKFVWADFTHWEVGGNAYWLMCKQGAALVPLRTIAGTTRAKLTELFESKLGCAHTLTPFDEAAITGRQSS